MQYGYAGKILRVDLSSSRITDMSTSEYADRFIGGSGVAAKIYWDEVAPEASAFDPRNCLVFMTGPLTGFPILGAGRWTICGKSPSAAPEQFCKSHLGGSWGARLKFAGYDGVVVQGKTEKPVYLLIQDGTAELRDASSLWGQGAREVRETLKRDLGSSVSVAACGPAGENMVTFAIILADDDASAANGFGAVMGSKRLKAIAIRGGKRLTAANPEKLQELNQHIRRMVGDEPRRWHFERDIVPHGYPPNLEKALRQRIKKQVCYGCSGDTCTRSTYQASDGTKGKRTCLGPGFYRQSARRFYGEWNEDIPFHANRLLDDYGLNIFAVDLLTKWLEECRKEGILTDENTGIPISKVGSLEFIQTVSKKIALRDGFGDILAQGKTRAAELVGRGSEKLVDDRYAFKGDEHTAHDPRYLYTDGLLLATEPRVYRHLVFETMKPLRQWLAWVKNDSTDGYVSSKTWRTIAKEFLGGELAVDFSTYDGKAMAAKLIQDREAVIGSLVLCMRIWPMMEARNTDNHVGDSTLESKLFSLVTGKETGREELCRIGEVVYNLERAIRVREGHSGRQSDILPEFYFTEPLESAPEAPESIAPGEDGEVISKKGTVLNKQEFERMKDEYYQFRGWDVATGLQKKTRLQELGLGEIAEDLEQRELIATPPIS